jgi:hypothetical protein
MTAVSDTQKLTRPREACKILLAKFTIVANRIHTEIGQYNEVPLFSVTCRPKKYDLFFTNSVMLNTRMALRKL